LVYIKKVKVSGNEKVELVFRTYLREKWIDLHQTSVIHGSVYRYHIVHFNSGNEPFLWYLFVCHTAFVAWELECRRKL